MKKRADLSLSVNAIVILILAIVMLGLGLGFIRGMFGKVSAQVEQQISTEPEPHAPTSSNQITLSRETLITRAAEKEVIKVSVFNPSNQTWSSVYPEIKCETGFTISEQSANAKEVKQGKFITFDVILTIPSAPPSTYLCRMGIDGDNDGDFDYQKDLTIKVIE